MGKYVVFTFLASMAYSIHGHISYTLEANSKRPNGFSLTGKKPNGIYNLSEKILMV